MLNFLGTLPDAAAALAVAGVHWHDYGKAPRAGRKTGHATVRADDIDGLIVALEALGRALHREAQVAPVIEQLRGR
jgi:5-(carboxyamino)imidazole ribonucleotide synthase